MEETKMTLATVNHGAACELFEQELDKVLANIADPNTKADGVREITLTVKFEPDDERLMANTTVTAKCKLQAPRAHKSVAFVDRDAAGKRVFVHQSPNQEKLPLGPRKIELKSTH